MSPQHHHDDDNTHRKEKLCHQSNKLNEYASDCIECGRYDDAIEALVHALQFAKEIIQQQQKQLPKSTTTTIPKDNACCSLDACVRYTQHYNDRKKQHQRQQEQEQSRRRKFECTSSSSDTSTTTATSNKRRRRIIIDIEEGNDGTVISEQRQRQDAKQGQVNVTCQQNQVTTLNDGHVNENIDNEIQQQQQQPPTRTTTTIGNDEENNNINKKYGGYVCRQPIRMVPQSILKNKNYTKKDGHSFSSSSSCCCFGMVRPLIITFNLALAHHLKILKELEDDGNENNTTATDTIDIQNLDDEETYHRYVSLRRVLQLYEMSYRWQMDASKQTNDNNNQGQQHQQQQQQMMSSLRFTMMISNNIGEIHRMVGSTEKHQLCLQHLLSTMMHLVSTTSTTTSTSSSSRINNGNTSTTTTTDRMEMDGYFQNTSQLILQDQCAGAA